ncbi:hypothetical protein [Hyphomicrobium sp. MC1]|uniref:hypothetical protein n=1 Tax=Hyphomicrobium sp. (strain MC1) TaxID=717785 RepID=UPI000213DA8C|nr:hypothetical protein [Hyphomicrobium sp. MC1]CCB64433.1 conserved protein of unknown function [Hyphomicrobium sp. MC1]
MPEKETRFTPGPWFVSGVRFRMNGNDWHSINRYNDEKLKDENIACVGFDPRTGLGFHDAKLIAAAPDLYEALNNLVATVLDYERVNNLSPAPGRKCCWDATEHAINALSKALGETP